MKEDFIYYLWENRLLHLDLTTTEGDEIVILSVGIRNLDSGADYNNARIKIGGTLWAGQVEIHVRSSDWYRHNHQDDNNYNNVILHVVYECDNKSPPIPTLEVKGKFDIGLLQNYETFLNSRKWIPCEDFIGGVHCFAINSWLDRMLVEPRPYRGGYIQFSSMVFSKLESPAWLLAR